MTVKYGQLVLTQPAEQEATYPLEKTIITIGSADTNDISLRRLGLARAHARLECGETGCTIIDLGSARGTLVNDEQVQTRALAMGDVIQMGDALLTFETAALPEINDATIVDSSGFLQGLAEAAAEAEGQAVRLRNQGDAEASFSLADTLLPLRSTGSRPPLFCVVAGHRDSTNLATLVAHLDAAQPVYVLQPPANGFNPKVFSNAEAVARHYINQVATVAAEGPYTLWGYSIGGLLAFEMARLLAADNHPLPNLTLLDTPFLAANPWFYLNYRVAQSFERYSPMLSRPLQPLLKPLEQVTAQVQGAVAQLTAMLPGGEQMQPAQAVRSAGQPDYQALLQDRGLEETLRVTRSYLPRRIPGSITLFLAQESPVKDYGTLWGWHSVAGEGVRDHMALGDHQSMLQEPFAALLARQLEPGLNDYSRKA